MQFYRKITLSLAIGLFLSALAHGQAAPNAKLEELRAAGFDALYNLDYDGARKNFSEIKRLYPQHPAGPQWLAATLWAQTLNELRGLQASLYSSDDFYAQGETKPDPKVAAEFKALTTEAVNLAKARLKENPKDVEALYFLGVTKGLKAAYKVGVERSFLGALGDGRDSVGHHEDVLKLDPAFTDAQVSIGLYNYTVASLPPFYKLLAGIGGIRGSKKKSFTLLQDVAAKGRWAQDDARSALILLYKREKRWADSLAVTREMATKYPRNYLFKLESADSLAQMVAAARGTPQAADLAREAFAIFDAVLRDKNAAKTLDLVHAKYGEALFSAGQFDKAAAEFLAAAATPGAEASLVTGARLRAGQALDLLGKRQEAVAQYNAVLQRPNVMNAHDQAKRGLKEPYKLAQTATATTADGGE
jgi:tetratricopeptide (TPR) repeat protein